MKTPKDELIELYYRRVTSMEKKIQELEEKIKELEDFNSRILGAMDSMDGITEFQKEVLQKGQVEKPVKRGE